MLLDIAWFNKFPTHLKEKNIKFLTDLELRKEIILFFNTTSWKGIYEIKKTLLALEKIKRVKKGFEVP